MPVTVSVRCKGELVRKFQGRASTYGLSINQYLKAKMIESVGELPDDFWNLIGKWNTADARAAFLRGM